jgi:hypothetical protein
LYERKPAQFCSILLTWLLLTPALPAAETPVSCGTERGNWREELHLHRMAERARRNGQLTVRGRAVPERAAVARDHGELALLDDAGGVIARRNPFNLNTRALEFRPTDEKAVRYRFQLGPAVFDEAASAEGAVLTGLGDDDSRPIDLPFEFPFFGANRTRAWVHSDGNLTFEEPDAASQARSLGRLAAGPPRIAALFADLDPSKADTDVRVWQGPGRTVITWRNVPEFRDFGTGPRQMVQLEIRAGGGILFTYASVTAGDIVAGISPGRLIGSAEVLSFSQGSDQSFATTVAERFGGSDSLDTVRAAQRFYETHEDSYDYLVFFNTAGVGAGANALANEQTVRSYRQGIGDSSVDNGAAYGSPARLQAVLNMGSLGQYPRDPYARVGSRGQITGDTTMTLLGHETGHLFLALASIRDERDPNARPMLGTQNAHWNFNFNSEASLLEGNRIQDLGGNRFLTVATVEGYSILDQYLMGFRMPEEVPPLFLVRNSSVPGSSFPQVNVTFSGSRQDFSVDELIAAEGRRVPASEVAQRRFRFAFVLIVPAGAEPAQAQLEQLETYRAEFERYFQRAAQDRAFADATLRRALNVSMWPAGGVVAGGEATATVSVARPSENDMTVWLYSPQDLLAYPPQIVIPAGSTSAAVKLQGVSAGVADLVFESSDGGVAPSFVRVAVQAAAGSLRLIRHYVDAGVVVVRVADRDELPYENILIRVQGRTEAYRTDQRGLAWIPAAAGESLAVEIDGAPESRLLVKTAQ